MAMEKVVTLLLSLLFLLMSIPQIRTYRRTGMKGPLVRGVGFIIGAIGAFGLSDGPLFRSNYSEMLFLFLIAITLLLHFISLPIQFIKESGLWKEICDNTTYWQRFTGNVPIMKYEKRDPTANRQVYLILGVVTMAGSIIGAVFFKLTMNYFSIGTIFLFIVGLLFIIFALVFLKKDKGQHK